MQPYYDTYASPYVEQARPYVKRVNDQVIAPGTNIAKHTYDRYAAPSLNNARAYGVGQWETLAVPQIAMAQKQASGLYQKNLGPYVEKASSAVGPYYVSATENVANVHQRHIQPAIQHSLPYLHKAYSGGQSWTVNTALPYTQYAWNHVVVFVDGVLWPRIRNLYGDNVKPQLVMISERIAKYQEGRKIKAVLDEVDSAAETSTISSSLAETATPVSSDTSSTQIHETVKMEMYGAGWSSKSPQPTPVATDDQIAADLKTWQEKFSKAAEKGSEDLQERLDEILASLISSNIEGDGRRLVTALQSSVEIQLQDVKSIIKSTASKLTEDATASDIAKAEEDVLARIRASGQEVRVRANEVRQWYSKLEGTIRQRVEAAVESTLDVLDGVRDLGLQEIGMRWSSLDGVTYKHCRNITPSRSNLTIGEAMCGTKPWDIL